jgi:hypothetical protein
VKKHIYDNQDKLIEIVEAEPVCGLDFCDSCGDCLNCYGGDECLEGYDGKHYWVVYQDKSVEDVVK